MCLLIASIRIYTWELSFQHGPPIETSIFQVTSLSLAAVKGQVVKKSDTQIYIDKQTCI